MTKKVNTFFAASTWYDDNDAEVFHRSCLLPFRASKIPVCNDQRTYYTDSDSSNPNRRSYKLTDQRLIETLQKRNKKAMRDNQERMCKEYEVFMDYIRSKNLRYPIEAPDSIAEGERYRRIIERRERRLKRRLFRRMENEVKMRLQIFRHSV